MKQEIPPSSGDRRGHRRATLLSRLGDGIYGAIRWIVDHVNGFYSALGVYLLLGLACVIATLGLFALVAQGMIGGVVQQFDDAAVIFARGLENDFLDGLALIGVGLGSRGAAWIVIITGTILFWRTHHRYSALLLWVAVGGARILNTLLKDWFDRPRPGFFRGDIELLGWEISFPTSPSFPSGHALTSTAIFFTLAYLVARLERPRWMRQLTFAAAAILVIMVCLSRVYLGVHYPSDVLAGFLAGVMWATFASLGIEMIRYMATRKPEVVADEQDLERGVEPIREALPG